MLDEASIKIIGVIVTILLAFFGYIITYLNDKRIHRREEELKLINARLEKFYGPLYFSTIAGEKAYKALLTKLGRSMVNDNPTNEELEEWRDWVTHIFMPNDRKQRDIIYNYGYLIVEDQPPQCFIDFVRHVSECEAILVKWSKADFTENFPSVDYPAEMQDYIYETYSRLKKEQIQLIGLK